MNYAVVDVLNASNHSGGNGKRDPPVLIPNTEVKPLNAGSTRPVTAREIMKLPDIIKKALERKLECFFNATAYSGTSTSLPIPQRISNSSGRPNGSFR